MMFNEQRFVQILEGEERAVEETFARIERDARHTALTVLTRRSESRRRFTDCPMAFVGHSRQCRAYYWYFTRRQDFFWERMDSAAVFDLMESMMDLDKAPFLQHE
jgi:hypothetical protein